jgi:farnesyl-diphosphate farnesyltransferase
VEVALLESSLSSPSYPVNYPLQDGVGEGDERALLEGFYNVNAAWAALPANDREIIRDICARMGEGMASYCGRDLREGTETLADYNQYAFIVAGLVGEGLTRLWVAHGDEAPALGSAEALPLAHEMGLFLQKTNIIRDYLEDLVEGRAFWPREVWKASTDACVRCRGRRGAGVYERRASCWFAGVGSAG